MRRLIQAGFIGLAAVVISTIAIQASDLVRGIDSAGLAIESAGPCGVGATLYKLNGSAVCVDSYEASPSSDCRYKNPSSPQDTAANLRTGECLATSVPEVEPWRHVSLSEAQQLCAKSGKRLPRGDEWYQVSLSLTDIDSCNIGSGLVAMTGDSGCVNSQGTSDLVGNVWEWVDETVTDGRYGDRKLPDSGYVSLADSDGVVLETSEEPNETFGSDYAWTNTEGVYGVIRGGFYDSDSDAGIYAQNLSVPFDLRVPGVGFRCVWDI